MGRRTVEADHAAETARRIDYHQSTPGSRAPDHGVYYPGKDGSEDFTTKLSKIDYVFMFGAPAATCVGFAAHPLIGAVATAGTITYSVLLFRRMLK